MSYREGPDWVSASEIGDFAFCPRSHWYSLHPPPTGTTPSSERSAAFGRKYHESALRGVRHRADHRLAYAGLAIGAAVLALVVLANTVGL